MFLGHMSCNWLPATLKFPAAQRLLSLSSVKPSLLLMRVAIHFPTKTIRRSLMVRRLSKQALAITGPQRVLSVLRERLMMPALRLRSSRFQVRLVNCATLSPHKSFMNSTALILMGFASLIHGARLISPIQRQLGGMGCLSG